MQRLSGSISPLSDLSAGRGLFLVFAAAVFALVLSLDRSFMLDEQSYIDYFVAAATVDWGQLFFGESLSFFGIAIGLFTEELLWRVWTVVVAPFLSPGGAVVFTVAVLNLLILRACWTLGRPNLALLVWIVAPYGLAAIGVMQIRQGFGLAVFFYFALVRERPVIGALLAALIHSTFLVVIPFAVLAHLTWRRPLLLIAGLVVAGASAAIVAGALFDIFGGRRIQDYIPTEGATSLNYVFGAFVCALPSIDRLLFSGAGETPRERVITNLAAAHIGITAFVVAAFFFFPLGTGRVGYMTFLMLIPILGSARLTRATESGVVAIAILALAYFTLRAWGEGTYLTLFA
jgi:hypothetical protein